MLVSCEARTRPTPRTQPNKTVATMMMLSVPVNDSVRKPRGEITGISLKMTNERTGMLAMMAAPTGFDE